MSTNTLSINPHPVTTLKKKVLENVAGKLKQLLTDSVSFVTLKVFQPFLDKISFYKTFNSLSLHVFNMDKFLIMSSANSIKYSFFSLDRQILQCVNKWSF